MDRSKRQHFTVGPHGMFNIDFYNVGTPAPPFHTDIADTHVALERVVIQVRSAHGALIADAVITRDNPELKEAERWLLGMVEVYYE